MMPSQQYHVNFSPELELIIREAKALDQLGGYELPQLILNLALQEEKYKTLVEQLEMLVGGVGEVVGDLSAVSRTLLQKQILELDECLSPGLNVLNWRSLGILDFIEEGNRGIGMMRSVRGGVGESQERIEVVVVEIEQAVLVRSFDWQRAEVMDPSEFYEFFEKHREQQVAELVKKYESISPFLVKIEETTVGTKTGSAPSMREYYQYWEKRIFNCITTMLIRAMATFQTLFGTGSEIIIGGGAPTSPTQNPTGANFTGRAASSSQVKTKLSLGRYPPRSRAVHVDYTTARTRHDHDDVIA